LKKIIVRASWVAVMLLLVSVLGNASTCTGGGSLSGWYGMLVNGGGKYLEGAVYFDGNCNLSGSNITGGVSGQYATTSVTGTYGENADGSFGIIMNLAGQTTPQTYTIGVSESGNKARGLESDNTVSATIDLQSQLTTLTSGYNTASLAGTYAASCFNGSVAHLNYVTFDGKGDVSGFDYYDIGGTIGTSMPYAGSYTVNSDGTFSGVLTGNYSGYTFNGVIDNGVSEIDYIYELSGSGVLSCVGKQSTTTTLSGYYGILVSGTGEYFSGSVYFNGTGGLTATNINGGTGSAYGNTTATGTYAVNSDSTVTINLNLASPAVTQTYVVGVSEAGNEADGVETDGSAVAIIDLQSQLQLPSTPYTVASLNGTYAASCAGTETDLNWVTYDGNGNISGVDAFNDGSYSSSPYTGTYTVSPDGTVTGHFADNATTGVDYSVFTLTGVLDNKTAEMEFTYDQSGVGGVVSCIGESTYGPLGTNAVAAMPTFNPAPGAFGAAQPVTLSDTTPGAVIYYTTNGATPTTSSPVYSSSAPIQVTATSTIQAIAVASSYNNSAIAAGTYFLTGLPTAVAPTFNPPPGPYTSAQSVTLTDTTPGAVIYYTTNGTQPGLNSSVYSPGSPIQVTATTTIQAFAAATGYNNSGVMSGTYTITASGTPVNPSAYYNVYGIGTAGIVPKSGGFDNDGYAYNSALLGASLSYQNLTIPLGTANALDAITSKTINLPAGQYGQLYLLGAAVNGAQTNQSIVVTYSDGSSSTFTQSFSDWAIPQKYTGETIVISTSNRIAPSGLTQTGTFDVYGYTFTLTAGKTVASVKLPSNRNVVFLGLGLSAPLSTAATPMFSVTPGTYTSPQSVALSDTTPGAVIYYTTNGTAPGQNSSVYNPSSPIQVTATTTIEAIAVATGYANSALASGTYTINLPTAATPMFSVAQGTYSSAQSVALSDTTPGAVIYYTTNGTAPGQNSSVYNPSSPIQVTATTTIEAIAVATGYKNSAVATALYTIGTLTPITPYIQVNGGSWQQIASVTVASGSTVNLGPQPLTGGSWSWTGPNGYTSTSRQINSIPLSTGTNTFVATYTNAAGVKSTQTFTITVTAAPTPIVPYIQVNGGSWQQTASASVSILSTVNLGPQPLTGGSWSWTGPHGYTSTSRQINKIPLSSGSNTYVATYTNSSGIKSTQTFTITAH
jgi:hypothetical protein